MNIKYICGKYRIKNYTVNSDGSIDVDGNVYLDNRKLTKLPLKFNNVNGSFYCPYNKLTTLEGSPKSIMGSFDCSNNKLTNLKNSPKYVFGNFYCGGNLLKSLSDGPDKVDGNFYCKNNKLITNKSKTKLKGRFYTTFLEDGLFKENYNKWNIKQRRKSIINKLLKK